MEPEQIAHINGNLTKLLGYTNVNVMLLAKLQEVGILSDMDTELVKGKTTDSEKAELLYKILTTKNNGYVHLINALHETCQSGAVSVLLTISSAMIGHLQVGQARQLKDFFNADQIVTIANWLNDNLSNQERFEIHKSVVNKTTLWRDTIPARYLLYISRILSRRVAVNPKLFQKSCSDVFVYKCINREKLRYFVSSYEIETSTSQLLKRKITARFILLDVKTDWKKICAKLQQTPVHLLKYDGASETFMLEATSGDLSILRQHLETCPAVASALTSVAV